MSRSFGYTFALRLLITDDVEVIKKKTPLPMIQQYLFSFHN